jgi:hypothetical protein
MLPSSCNEKNCPGWLGTMVIGIVAYVLVTIMFMKDVMAQEVVVTFNRELPFKSYEFTRTFEDKEAFEMWLALRLEDKGCDPYLKSMHIQFKS